MSDTPNHQPADSETVASPDLHPWEVSPQQVKQMRDRGESFLLVDCRKPEELEICEISGCLAVPMQDLDVHMDELREHQDRPIVVYCHTGRRSMTVTTVLREQGFANVRSMAGGIHRWSLEIDTSVPTYKK